MARASGTALPSARANGFRFDGSGCVTSPSQPHWLPGVWRSFRAVFGNGQPAFRAGFIYY